MHRHGRNAAYVALTAALTFGITGCTSSATPHHSASAPPTTPTASTPSTPTSSSASPVGQSGPPTVAHPTVPPDVPRTGPNLHPGDKPPVMPLEATQHTAAGAKAFAEFFIKTIDWAYATTSTTYMRHYFTQSCVDCRSTADAVDKAARAHHHFVGDRFHQIRASGGNMTSSKSLWFVDFEVTSTEVLDTHNKFVNAYPAINDFQEHEALAWTSSGWRVVQMTPKVKQQ